MGKRWYINHWDAGEYAARLPVEVAPSYFFCEQAPQRIRDFTDQATVVCTLREPVSRLVSLYYHRRRAGVVRAVLTRAIQEDRILRRSLYYGPALRRWAQALGEGRVKVFYFEDMRDQPARFVRDLEAALGWQACNSAALPQGAVNEGSLPRSYYGAKVLRWASYGLRSVGAYDLVDLGRRMGVKKLVVGNRPLPTERLSEGEAEQLRALLAPDVADVEGLVGRVPASWQSARTVNVDGAEA